MENTRSDYARGLDKGLALALEIINDTADVRFESIAEVGLYLCNPEEFAHYQKPAKDLDKTLTTA